MRGIGKFGVLAGILALAVGIVSRYFREPIQGIEAHAILSFAQACFLMSIAAFLWDRGES